MRVYVRIERGDGGWGDRERLYKCFHQTGIIVNKVVRHNNIFFLIAEDEQLDKILDEDNVKIFDNEGFTIRPPPEHMSMFSTR